MARHLEQDISAAPSEDTGLMAAAGQQSLQDAAEAIGNELDVVGAFLRVMQGMALSAVMNAKPGDAPTLMEIEASSLDIVLNDLAMRCKKAGQEVVRMGYGDRA